MICTYRVYFSNGESQTFKCSVFQLKIKVAEKFTNIPMDQIVLIDKDNKLFDLNKTLTQTYMINPNIEQMYKQVDLQKLIMEWSQMKIDNDWQQKTIEASQNKVNELNNQIERHYQEQEKNQTKSQINNNTIIQLRDDLERQTQQYSQERYAFQDTIKDLRSKLSEETNLFEQQKQQFEYTFGDLTDKLKAAEDKIQKQLVDIQQLNNQIQEKEIIIQNINQSLYSQQQQWQQYINNYQQQVAQQIQAYELTIKELTQDKESLDQKLKTEKTKNQCTTEKLNELENQLNYKETLNKKLEANIQKLKQQIEANKREQENLELERNRAAQQGQNINNEAQRLRQDLLKQQNENSQLKFVKDQLQQDFESFKHQDASYILSTVNQQLQEEVTSLNTKITQLNNEIKNLNKQLSDANNLIKDRDAKIEQAQQEYQKLQLQLEQLKSTSNNLSQQKITLEQNNQQLQHELNNIKKLYEAEKTNYRTAENDKTKLKGELKQKDIQICSEKTSHETTKKEKIYYQEQCKKMADQFKQLQQQTTNETQLLQRQVAVADKKIERVLQNFGETKTFEKITGPLEKIMISQFKINKFTEDPNSQSDNAQYNLIEITLQFDKYTQYVREGKFFLIDECFQYGMKININTTRSIKVNAESEFYKGYLIKITESPLPDLEVKTLLRKDLKLQNLAFQNKEEAARLAVNNIFCQWLQIQFNKDLETAKLLPQKQTIQRQFIIENEAKKEFYYCEMVEEGPFQKINGGKFVPQKDDIHQYFNGLSSYSYKMFEQQLILNNFQVCGNYVYDMIVHSNHKGLFSPLDQGSHEAMTFIDTVSKQPADIMSKYWNDTVKSQVENYLRR